MMRRILVVSSVGLLALASVARGDWSDWQVTAQDQIIVRETAGASSGPDVRERCVTIGRYDFVSGGVAGEVWCNDGSGLALMERIATGEMPSVAMDAAPGAQSAPTPPSYVVSDPSGQLVWYGVVGQNPELALQQTVARSVSLVHYSDGTPLLVYRGQGDHLYTASRKPTGEWGESQLTNNTSGTNRWSVDAAITHDVLHIAYWDATWQAVR
jgi:hypothetical protein